jgi:hypothetical protein
VIGRALLEKKFTLTEAFAAAGHVHS